MAKSANIGNELDKTLNGRIVHNVPNSLFNKPKPSDSPTVILEEGDSDNVPNNVTSSQSPKEVDVSFTPDTTVLGLDMSDYEEENKEEKSKQEEIKQEESKQEKPKKNKSAQKKTKVAEKKPKKATQKKNELVLIRQSNGEKINITKTDFVIGKSKFSDFQVKGNNTVSRSHLIVHRKSAANIAIEDNNSKNGTFVDEVRVEAHEEIKLKAGQTIRLSDEIFNVEKVS